MPLYEHAREIYEKTLPAADARIGSLYNNMATCLTRTGSYAEAETMYQKALEIMRQMDTIRAQFGIVYPFEQA